MEDATTILIVGSDISLAELEGDMIIGEEADGVDDIDGNETQLCSEQDKTLGTILSPDSDETLENVSADITDNKPEAALADKLSPLDAEACEPDTSLQFCNGVELDLSVERSDSGPAENTEVPEVCSELSSLEYFDLDSNPGTDRSQSSNKDFITCSSSSGEALQRTCDEKHEPGQTKLHAWEHESQAQKVENESQILCSHGEEKLVDRSLNSKGDNQVSAGKSENCTATQQNQEDVTLKAQQEVPLNSSSVQNANCDIRPNGIESLPEELLVKVFSYFNPKELCEQVAPVSRHWHDLAYEPTLWKAFRIEPVWGVGLDSLCTLLKRISCVHSLCLRGLNMMNVDKVFELCPQLSELDLGLCDNVDLCVIISLVKFCPLMKSLSLDGCISVNLEGVQQLTLLQHLTHVNLAYCRLEDDSVLLLAHVLNKIVSFSVDGVSWITDKAIISLCELHRSTLESLELDGEELTDDSIRAVSTCLDLHTFSISFCDLLTDQSLTYLKALKKLKKLRLRKGPNFTDETVADFFRNRHLTNIRNLDLSECVKINNTALCALTQCCGKGLKSLTMQWCWNITDVGLEAIVDNCSNLQLLDLTGLRQPTGECFSRVPSDMPQLRFMNLCNCNNINDKLIRDMVCNKPNVRVINYYGEVFVYGETFIMD